MTELLSRLLHDEADRLDVPAPDTAALLTRGRRVRRRRRQVRAGAAVAVAAACALGFLAQSHAPDRRRLDGDVRIADSSRALAAYASEGAYAVDDVLVIGANRFRWHEAIKALHYTSAGVVIQSGQDPDRDEGASRYALVTPTGTWSDVDVALEDQVAGFETTSSRFAYAEPAGTGYDLVVHDAVTDEEVARRHVELADTTIGWRAPPVAIHGDVVWVRGDTGWTEWDWTTDAVREVAGSGSTYEVSGGVWADWQDRERWLVRSTADGNLLRELDLRDGWYGFLSPDGRYLRAFPNERGSQARVDFEFFSVATGQRWTVSDVVDSHERVDHGWTPDGHVLQLLDDTLSRCDVDSATCEVIAERVGAGTVRLGGEPYGS